VLPLLADRARSECARSMRAVGSTPTTPAGSISHSAEWERVRRKATWEGGLRAFGYVTLAQLTLWYPLGSSPTSGLGM